MVIVVEWTMILEVMVMIMVVMMEVVVEKSACEGESGEYDGGNIVIVKIMKVVKVK